MFNNAMAIALKRHMMKNKSTNPTASLGGMGALSQSAIGPESTGDTQTIKHELFDKREEDSDRDKTADLAPVPKNHKFEGLIVTSKK